MNTSQTSQWSVFLAGSTARIHWHDEAGTIMGTIARDLSASDAHLIVADHNRNLRHALSPRPSDGPGDSAMLDWLGELYRNCPHAEIHYNDDADQEPWPVGYTLHVDGCEPLTITKPTMRELFTAAMAQEGAQ